MPSYSTSTPQEQKDTQAAFNAAIDVVLTALTFFNDEAKDPSLSPDEVQAFLDAATEAAQDASLLSRKLRAYMNDSPLGDVTPPDPALVAQVQGLQKDLSVLILTNNAVSDVISTTTQLLQLMATF